MALRVAFALFMKWETAKMLDTLLCGSGYVCFQDSKVYYYLRTVQYLISEKTISPDREDGWRNNSKILMQKHLWLQQIDHLNPILATMCFNFFLDLRWENYESFVLKTQGGAGVIAQSREFCLPHGKHRFDLLHSIWSSDTARSPEHHRVWPPNKPEVTYCGKWMGEVWWKYGGGNTGILVLYMLW